MYESGKALVSLSCVSLSNLLHQSQSPATLPRAHKYKNGQFFIELNWGSFKRLSKERTFARILEIEGIAYVRKRANSRDKWQTNGNSTLAISVRTVTASSMGEKDNKSLLRRERSQTQRSFHSIATPTTAVNTHSLASPILDAHNLQQSTTISKRKFLFQQVR